MKLTRSNVANVITASRFFLAIVIVLLFLFDTTLTRRLLLIVTVITFLTDVIDGPVARRFGSASVSKAGSVLDSLADDFVFIAAFICLFSKGLVPIFFILLVFWVRSLIALVRLLATVRGEPYPGPRFSTRAKGASYGIGIIYLIGVYSFADLFMLPSELIITRTVVGIMFLLTVLAAFDFLIVNRRVVIALFSEQKVG